LDRLLGILVNCACEVSSKTVRPAEQPDYRQA
jgi:hypothetical protein